MSSYKSEEIEEVMNNVIFYITSNLIVIIFVVPFGGISLIIFLCTKNLFALKTEKVYLNEL